MNEGEPAKLEEVRSPFEPAPLGPRTNLRIAIVGYAMAFGPNTLEKRGLGGSETAQLCMGKELADLGHDVHQFINLDPDDHPPGYAGDGVCYHDVRNRTSAFLEQFDVAVVCRATWLKDMAPRSRKTVLWIQDFATPDYPRPLPDARFDEIWAVSYWQVMQWHQELLGKYFDPLTMPKFWVTRNGIPHLSHPVGARNRHHLVFASRPERGLWPLVRDGGIMDRLPQHTLFVAGYDDKLQGFEGFYAQLNDFMSRKRNVVQLGSLRARHLRQRIADSWLYVMPTPYKETSCILARECIEVGTPMIVTPSDLSGALTETLGECAIIGSYAPFDSEQFIQDFVAKVEQFTHPNCFSDRAVIQDKMHARTDLYYPPVAQQWVLRMRELLKS